LVPLTRRRTGVKIRVVPPVTSFFLTEVIERLLAPYEKSCGRPGRCPAGDAAPPKTPSPCSSAPAATRSRTRRMRSSRSEQLGLPAAVTAAYAATARSLIAVIVTLNEQIKTLGELVGDTFWRAPGR
jgi:hypothetical protein